jgi:2-polyprenyl-6-methoxyphenol hydroxylase-like FAD-dependent oxidoreductase
MLIDGVDDWPENESVIGTEGDFHFLVFPRSGGKVRLYLGHQPGTQPALSGASKQQAFFDTFRFSTIPGVERLQAGAVAGPAAFYGSHDCWLDHGGVPYGEGALLIGDAAGYSDPIIGQGVSIAFTDVVGTSQALLSTDDWSPGLFTDYGVERKERMRRIAISAMLHSAVFSDFTPGGRERREAFHEATAAVAQRQPHDPADGLMFMAVAVAIQAGGMNMPAEAFSQENIDRVVNLGQETPVPADRWRLE